MRKLLALFGMLLLVAAPLTGCSGGDEEAGDDTSQEESADE